MKKLIVVLLVLSFLLCSTSVAYAFSWDAPPTQLASPFAIEVIKLKPHIDATGNQYYTQITNIDYTDTTIYYAIKLTLPSYADANTYYKTSDLCSGSQVKVVINYTNIANKTQDVVYATLTDQPQTLFYNGSSFTNSLNYVLSALRVSNYVPKISAVIQGRGALDNIVISNSYKVKSHTFDGMSGYLVYGSHSAFDAFFEVRHNKFCGIYVVETLVTGDIILHKMTSPTWVSSDTQDRAYLNSINHVLSLLGLSYQDIGNVYMTDELWLQNFGFSTNITSTADWGYTAQIVTYPTIEVPKTGDFSITGICLCAVAIVGAIIARLAYRRRTA